MIDPKIPTYRAIKSESNPKGTSTYEVEVIETATRKSLGWARVVGGAYLDSDNRAIDFMPLGDPANHHRGRVAVNAFATKVEVAHREQNEQAQQRAA